MNRDFEAFFKANEQRIHYQIHRLGITGDWYDDFYAEGLTAIWYAYKNFDPEKGELGTYVNYLIRLRLIDLLRKTIKTQEADEKYIEEGKKRLLNGNYHRATGKPIVDVIGIDVKDDAFWNEVRSRLTDKQWKWVQYYIIAGLTVKEIMEIENVSADAVKGWGRAVRKKLRDEELRKKLEKMV